MKKKETKYQGRRTEAMDSKAAKKQDYHWNLSTASNILDSDDHWKQESNSRLEQILADQSME